MKHSWHLSYVALLLALSAGTTAWSADPAAPVPLGAAEFRPTPERPIGWRGDGTGCYPGATPPTEWSVKPRKNIRWSTTVGMSYSSPVVTDKFVLVTSEPDLLVCLDRADGKVKWKAAVKASELADETSRKAAEEYEAPQPGAGMFAATPLCDGARIYVVLANGIVRAVDMDGKTQWTSYIDAQQSSSYGRSASPILVAGKLIVHMTNLYAFDPATGKELWNNTETKSTYGTPMGFKSGEVDLIATPDGDVVRADTGKIVKAGIGHASNPSPVVKDGVVYFGDTSVAAVRLGAAFKPENLWQGEVTSENMADKDIFGSPLVQEGLMFIMTGSGKLYTFDAQGKGAQEPVIAGRVIFDDGGGGGGNPLTYSCITYAGKYLFVNSTKGDQVVLEPTREAKEVARNTLPDGTGASPTFSGSEMFIRDGEKILCIGH